MGRGTLSHALARRYDGGRAPMDGRGRLQQVLDRYARGPEATPEMERAFSAYARDLNLDVAQLECLLVLLAAPLYLVPDLLLFGMGSLLLRSVLWRCVLCAAALGSLGLLALLRRSRVEPVTPFLVGVGVLHVIIIGLGVGAMGGVDGPLFCGFYLLAFISTPLVVPPRPRALAVALLLASAMAAFFLPYPQHLRHPHVPMTLWFLVFTGVVALAIGHTISHLVRQNFLRAQLLSSQHLRLEELNQDLERRVAARTEEVRLLAARLDSLQEEDRARIARELHDELGQILTSMRLELGLSRVAGEARLHGLLDHALAALHDVVSAIRPRLLDDLGLSATVAWLMQRHEERTGAECEWAIEVDEDRIDRERATALFRILQESLTNVARHARARRVVVRLTEEGGSLRLSVRDDGVGFAGPAAPGRLGLLGMRERARSFGGELSVAGAPGGGTEVTARLPLGAAHREGRGP